MKNIFIGALFLLASGSVQAAADCTDMWGNRANITLLDNKHIKIDFEKKRTPSASRLGYNGSNWNSHYFTSGSKMAQVEKTVFTKGVGKFWYHYPANKGNSKIVVKFFCE